MRSVGLVSVLWLLTGCSTLGDIASAPLRWVGLGSEAESAPEPMSVRHLLAHTSELASDRYEGRLPGTRGEQLSVTYIESQFREMGLAPGNPDGSYRQSVPLVGIKAEADVGVQVAGQSLPMRIREDVVIGSERLESTVRVRRSPLVFVGYGVQAPEYDWDDYKGLDVRGKTLLMLVNDPPVTRPGRPDQLDERTFRGRAMTYYGRWTYKYEIASKLGAAAVLVIHETGPAGYPWEVPAQGSGNEHFTLDDPHGNSHRVPVQGWIRDRSVARLLAAAGQDFAALKQAAAQRDFHPVSLPAQASFQLRQTLRPVQSANVVALSRGSRTPDDYLVVTAHWDHLGRDASRDGDQIYNGAVDNAASVAGLLELGREFARHPAQRSVLFLAVTAEEQGLLGARHYVRNPLYPLTRTWANFNMDGPNVWGRTADVPLSGYGQSSLDDVLIAAASAQGRRVVPEPEPEKGYYFRSDHLEFARAGVPGLFIAPLGGTEFVGPAQLQAASARQAYIGEHYHKVTDEVTDAWDLSGYQDDLNLLATSIRDVAAAAEPPRWKAGSEFAQTRKPRHP